LSSLLCGYDANTFSIDVSINLLATTNSLNPSLDDDDDDDDDDDRGDDRDDDEEGEDEGSDGEGEDEGRDGEGAEMMMEEEEGEEGELKSLE
jgi:hypothetical protein